VPATIVFVEGVVDAIILSQIAQRNGFTRLTAGQDHRPFNEPRQPRTDRTATVLSNGNRILSINPAGGNGEIPGLAKGQSSLIGVVDAIGFVIDADTNIQERFDALKTAMATAVPSWPVQAVAQPGQVAPGPPRIGIFVCPDNANPGAIETIVVQAGQALQPDDFNTALSYVQTDCAARTAAWPPHTIHKATVSAVGAITKPGASNASLVADNPWVVDALGQAALADGLENFLLQLV
jgi:hypothetical protein